MTPMFVFMRRRISHILGYMVLVTVVLSFSRDTRFMRPVLVRMVHAVCTLFFTTLYMSLRL